MGRKTDSDMEQKVEFRRMPLVTSSCPQAVEPETVGCPIQPISRYQQAIPRTVLVGYTSLGPAKVWLSDITRTMGAWWRRDWGKAGGGRIQKMGKIVKTYSRQKGRDQVPRIMVQILNHQSCRDGLILSHLNVEQELHKSLPWKGRVSPSIGTRRVSRKRSMGLGRVMGSKYCYLTLVCA